MSVNARVGGFYKDTFGSVYECVEFDDTGENVLNPFVLKCVCNKVDAPATDKGEQYRYNKHGHWHANPVSDHNLIVEYDTLEFSEGPKVFDLERLLGMCMDIARRQMLPVDGVDAQYINAMAKECVRVMDNTTREKLEERLK